MPVNVLTPDFALLSEEYVLVQAWKKTTSYIRHHNWYADTLALDATATNLPRFLAGVAELLTSPEGWKNQPLRLVPAPKSQQWRVREQWEPVKGTNVAASLRPLAHASVDGSKPANCGHFKTGHSAWRPRPNEFYFKP